MTKIYSINLARQTTTHDSQRSLVVGKIHDTSSHESKGRPHTTIHTRCPRYTLILFPKTCRVMPQGPLLLIS